MIDVGSFFIGFATGGALSALFTLILISAVVAGRDSEKHGKKN